MPVFYYHARDAQRRIIAGELSADNVDDAIGRLEASGLAVEAIGSTPLPAPPPPTLEEANADDTSSPSPTTANAQIGERSLGDDAEVRQLVSSQLAAVRAQSQDLLPALRAFAEEMPDGRQRRELSRVLQILSSTIASPRSSSTGNDDDILDELDRLPHYWLPLLSAATSTRDPGRMLRQFLDESQRTQELRSQAWRALAYPAVVVLTAATVFVFYCVVVTPIFREIFDEFGLVLPPLTAALLAVSASVESGQVFVVLAACVALCASLAYAGRWLPWGVRTWFAERCVTPVGRAISLARFTRYAADLLEAGVPLPSAVQLAGHATRSRRVQQAAWRWSHPVAHDAAAATTQKPAQSLTHSVLHVLNGTIPIPARIRLLRELSENHAERAEAWLSWSRGIVEPFAVVVVGIVVGLTTLALFLPMVRLTSALS